MADVIFGGVFMAASTLDKIHIRDLRTTCIVGIYPDERENKQEVCINITLHADLSKPCLSDDIDDTVNYKDLKKRVLELIEPSCFFLIERMAEEVARICLEDPRVHRCNVCVDKPGALRFARSVAIEIERSRG